MIISGGYGVATGGPLAWGLCYNKEMSPSKLYCDDYYKYAYPCTPGVSYHGRGALPSYLLLRIFLPLMIYIHPPRATPINDFFSRLEILLIARYRR